jgi:hypothetical protein
MTKTEYSIAYAAAYIGGRRLVVDAYTAGQGKINRPTDWALIADSDDQLVTAFRECLVASESRRPPREFDGAKSVTLTWDQEIQELGQTKNSVRLLPWLTMQIESNSGDYEVAATIFDKAGLSKYEATMTIPGPSPSDEALQSAVAAVLNNVRTAASKE